MSKHLWMSLLTVVFTFHSRIITGEGLQHIVLAPKAIWDDATSVWVMRLYILRNILINLVILNVKQGGAEDIKKHPYCTTFHITTRLFYQSRRKL